MSDCPHFDVEPPFDGAQLKQIQDTYRTVGKTICGRKEPAVPGLAVVMFPSPIPRRALFVSAMNPACQSLGDLQADPTERLRSDDVSVVVAPSSNFGVQPGQEAGGWCTHLGPDELPDRLQERKHTFLGRPYRQLAGVLTNTTAEEVKALVDVHDLGLLQGDGQTSFCEEFRNHREDRILQQLASCRGV